MGKTSAVVWACLPRAASDLLGRFLFPGPDLPKPAVISQLEQGAEIWVAERGGTRACHPGKNPTKWVSPLGSVQEATGDILLEKMMFQGPWKHLFLRRFPGLGIILLTALTDYSQRYRAKPVKGKGFRRQSLEQCVSISLML